jgi:hypothetical protein
MTTKLEKLGFTGPYQENEDGTVNATFRGLPYHIHHTATADEWVALQEAIASGDVTIVPYAPPAPVVVDPVVALKKQIVVLEKEITARRLREAVLGTEELVDLNDGKGAIHPWLAVQEDKIAALRVQIASLEGAA